MNQFSKQLFLVDWRDTMALQNPDIEGALLRSMLFSHSKFNCICCPRTKKLLLQHSIKQQFDDFGGLSNVPATAENTAIILEILKYYGRDVNVVEAYGLFKKIHERYIEITQMLPVYQEMTVILNEESQFRLWFMRALSDLKFMGMLSTTKQNTFIFKKNIFGKAKFQKIESDQQTQLTAEAVTR